MRKSADRWVIIQGWLKTPILSLRALVYQGVEVGDVSERSERTTSQVPLPSSLRAEGEAISQDGRSHCKMKNAKCKSSSEG